MTNSHNDDSIKKIHPISISVRSDKVVYPLGATVHVRFTVSDIIVGKKMIIQVFNQEGKSLFAKKIDLISHSYKPKPPFYQISFKMKGKQWKIGSVYTIMAKYGDAEVSDSYIIDSRHPVIQTDRSVYVLGHDIILTVVDPDANLDSQKVETLGGLPNQQITISTGKDTIANYRLVETGKDTGIFQGTVHLLPEHSKKPRKGKGPFDGAVRARQGEKITFTYFNGKEIAVVYAYSSNFGATIQLDQKVYTWTDKVYIAVVAPDHNYNPNAIDEIKVNISTKKHTLNSYILKESGPDTGIFVGTVILTGDPKIVRKDGIDGKGLLPSGKYGGQGPSDGLLPASNDDGISVSFEFTEGQEVTASSMIGWNIGMIKWLEPKYDLESEATIQIVDPDMNLNPNVIDEFDIRVWSNTNLQGIELKMKETGTATGVFQGKVILSSKQSSTNNLLKVTEGDEVRAEYVDRTVPPPYDISSNLRLIAMTKVGKTFPPLERILLQNPVILDENNRSLTQISKNHLAKITATIKNNQNVEQPFAFIAQIQNEKDVVISDVLYVNGLLKPLESLQPSLLWMPQVEGMYNIQIFVWKGKEEPSSLSTPAILHIDVTD